MQAESQHRVVRGAFRGEIAPQTTEVQAHESVIAGLAAGLFKIVDDFTLEIGLIGSTTALWLWLSRSSTILATACVVGTWATLLRWRLSRGVILRGLKHAHLRRRFDKAARFAGLATVNDHVPRPVRVKDFPAGAQLYVRIPSGSAASYLENASERLATCLDARAVRVEPDLAKARYANVTILRRDPYGDEPLAWPHSPSVRLSIWNPIPVGVNELGETVTVSLPERNMLIGGEPGAGKSVALSQLVATAALDPDCHLTLLDGKEVELACWEKCARYVVGPSIDDAIEVLGELRAEMTLRYRQIKSEGIRKVQPGWGFPLHVVVCDELAFYMTMGNKKQNDAFTDCMRDLVSRGRAAGMIVLAATQRPSADVIDTSVRDLFAFRWAMRCTTSQASDMVLGKYLASDGYSAADIDPMQRGEGLLLHEEKKPIRMKSFCLVDEDLQAIAARASILRSSVRNLKVAS